MALEIILESLINIKKKKMPPQRLINIKSHVRTKKKKADDFYFLSQKEMNLKK